MIESKSNLTYKVKQKQMLAFWWTIPLFIIKLTLPEPFPEFKHLISLSIPLAHMRRDRICLSHPSPAKLQLTLLCSLCSILCFIHLVQLLFSTTQSLRFAPWKKISVCLPSGFFNSCKSLLIWNGSMFLYCAQMKTFGGDLKLGGMYLSTQTNTSCFFSFCAAHILRGWFMMTWHWSYWIIQPFDLWSKTQTFLKVELRLRTMQLHCTG